MPDKIVCVELITPADHTHGYVELPGIAPDTPLKPRHARQVVRWLGLIPGDGTRVYVWSAEPFGYAVYPNSELKVARTFEWTFDKEIDY